MEKQDHSLFDQKCPTCGSWMESIVRKSTRGKEVITYSCNECGLNYSVDK